jgi:GT2 family glycosyltransferase
VVSADAPFAVLIPERGRPDELALTLSALRKARERIDTPHRVHVLVNGAPAADYRALQTEHADVAWQFHPRALGYHGAIARLLAASDEPWVYLLNSDMRLAPDALAQVLPWRAADVFAIASQIEFVDRTRRREETGWTVPARAPDGQLELHDREPVDLQARGHLYAGGGSSLFQSAPLKRYLARSHAYAPFYFEDADWGLQAWAEGLSVLFCPASRALHAHRATIGRYVPARTVERVIRRNLAHLRWRYGDLFGAPRWHGGKLDRLGALWRALDGEHRAARQRLRASPAGACLDQLHHQRHPHPQRWRAGHPRVLLVSPFAVLPPAHGGARRIVELARTSAEAIDWILLHDEASAQPQPASGDDTWFRAIHPVGGRPDSGNEVFARWDAHAHPRMLAELRRLIVSARPDVVCFEHVEAIGLIENLACDVPVVWTLHDAGRALPPGAQARVGAALTHVTALALTTAADLGYWQHPREVLVENGVRLPDAVVAPSPQGGPLLLVAPLRYRPNREGLRDFLDLAWPALRERHPALRLRVLAGEGGAARWGGATLPAGVELVDGHVDPAPHYASALLALNPQGEIEGSALKLAEALAHGRVMVSTATGARGFEALDTPALVRVAGVAAMADAIKVLVNDSARRHQAEAQARAAIAPWSWTLRVQPWVELVTGLAQRQ